MPVSVAGAGSSCCLVEILPVEDHLAVAERPTVTDHVEIEGKRRPSRYPPIVRDVGVVEANQTGTVIGDCNHRLGADLTEEPDAAEAETERERRTRVVRHGDPASYIAGDNLPFGVLVDEAVKDFLVALACNIGPVPDGIPLLVSQHEVALG